MAPAPHSLAGPILTGRQPPVFGAPGTRVVVRGTGSIGERHLRVLRDRIAVNPIAYPVRPDRTEEWRARGFDVVISRADLERYAPRLAIVATDTARHVSDAIELLQFGCDVLVEKPVSVDAAAADRLAQVIRDTGRRVFVGYCLRFDPGLLEFRRWLPRLGRLHAVRAASQSFLPDWRPQRDHRTGYAARPGEGGVLRDLSHEIDYTLWLFGRPAAVYAAFQNTGTLGIAVEEGADLAWQTPDGVAVSMRLDYLTRKPRRCLEAIGREGELAWDAVAGTVTLTLAGATSEQVATGGDRDAMFVHQAEAFLRAAAGGNAGALCTFDEARATVRVCDAAQRSAATGCSEAVAS